MPLILRTLYTRNQSSKAAILGEGGTFQAVGTREREHKFVRSGLCSGNKVGQFNLLYLIEYKIAYSNKGS